MIRFLKNTIQTTARRFGYQIQKYSPDHHVRNVITTHYYGKPFQCFEGDTLTQSLQKSRGWDEQLKKIAQDHIDPKASGCIIEVGANIGASLLPIASGFSDVTFHCYEPVPDFFEVLKLNHATYNQGNVRIYNQAMSNGSIDHISIYIGLGTAGKSDCVHYQEDHGLAHVEATSIDARHLDEEVHLVKIDVDGFELDVLQGAQKTLEKWHPGLFIEYAPALIRDLGEQFSSIPNFLQNLGYNKISVWDSKGQPLLSISSWVDLLKLAPNMSTHVDIYTIHEDVPK